MYTVLVCENDFLPIPNPTIVRAQLTDLHQLVGVISEALELDAYYARENLAVSLAAFDASEVHPHTHYE